MLAYRPYIVCEIHWVKRSIFIFVSYIKHVIFRIQGDRIAIFFILVLGTHLIVPTVYSWLCTLLLGLWGTYGVLGTKPGSGACKTRAKGQSCCTSSLTLRMIKFRTSSLMSR